MALLKAFVGHSFCEADQIVIRSFLKFFDTVKSMNLGFSWDHAESAESRDLAEKVKRLMENKNLFIGICTKREAIFDFAKTQKQIFSKKILKISEDQIQWKTSDWIIQEIGLAVGMKMNLILMVENGLQLPSGLQGSLEYIPFDRQIPEKSFQKILEMIQSLLPKEMELISEEFQSPTAPTEKIAFEQKKNEPSSKPMVVWVREDFEMSLLNNILEDNKEGEIEIFKAYLDSEQGKIPGNRESLEAYQEYWKIVLDKGGKLTTLENFAKVSFRNSKVQSFLAEGYLYYQEYQKAALCFETAAEKAENQNERLQFYGDAAHAYFRGGQKADEDRIIHEMKIILPEVENGEEQLVRTLLKIAEAENDLDVLFGLSEKLLALCPSDKEIRFSLAYKYAQEEEPDLALYHYLKIPYPERDDVTWNNLGVQFDYFEMVGKSVIAYQNARELGNTLAMSNLAYKLMREGFIKEAEDICIQATRTEKFHKNVGTALSRIKEIPEAEEKKEQGSKQKATPVSEFYRNYGLALIGSQLKEHIGIWQGPDCELRITIKGNVFLAEGRFEQAEISASALDSFAGVTDKPKVNRYLVRYEGTIVGRSVKAHFIRRKEAGSDAEPRPFGSIDRKIATLMFFSEALIEIQVYEKIKTKENKIYKLKHLDQNFHS